MTVHENGARRHGADWISANQTAVAAIMEAGLRPSDEKLKTAIPLVLLRVLDWIHMSRGETWDKELAQWRRVETGEKPVIPAPRFRPQFQ